MGLDLSNDLGQDGEWGAAGLDQPMRLQGDFYNEPDNATRGCVVLQGTDPCGHDFGTHEGSVWDSQFWFSKAPDLNEGLMLSGHDDFLAHSGIQAIINEPRFSDSVAPREAEPGGFARTTVTILSSSAAEVAACIYKFLKSEVAASIRKVTPNKFAIKADIFNDVGGNFTNCLLKVRVLRPPGQESQGLLVEFNRRQGDVVSFGHFFAQASAHLLRCFPGSLGRSPASQAQALQMPPVPSVPEKLAAPQGDLQPLLDMVMNNDAPPLQAEAMAALVTIAGAGAASAAAMCGVLASLQLQEVLVSLWTDARIDVAYPAARLATELARHGADASAAQLLTSALQGAIASSTDRLVRLQLAEAVRAGACRSPVPGSAASCRGDLRAALTEALRSSACCSEEAVAVPLREALTALEGNSLHRLDGVLV